MARPKTLTDEQKKSARISLLLTPQLHKDIITLTQIKKMSVNDLFTTLAAQVVNKNRLAIDIIQKASRYMEPTVDLTIDADKET